MERWCKLAACYSVASTQTVELSSNALVAGRRVELWRSGAASRCGVSRLDPAARAIRLSIRSISTRIIITLAVDLA